MASTESFYIPRQNDNQIYQIFEKLSDITSLEMQYTFQIMGGININTDNPSELDEATRKILSKKGHLLIFARAYYSSFRIDYRKFASANDLNQADPYLDTITIYRHENASVEDNQVIDIVAYVTEKLVKPLTSSSLKSLPQIQAQSAATNEIQANTERLQAVTEQILTENAVYRKKLDEEFDERKTKLETEFSEKNRKKEEALNTQQEKLDELTKQLDDRDNTHVRREIRERMLEDIQTRVANFSLSTSTNNKRLPILIAIILVFALLTIFLGYTYMPILSEIVAAESAEGIDSSPITNFMLWMILIKASLISFGLVGVVFFYIRWQGKWADKHADSELQLQRFYIDINRASWVIESALEWRKETDSVIPSELLSSITNNLFCELDENHKEELDPSDELAKALLGSSANLKLKILDNELDIKKPGNIKKPN